MAADPAERRYNEQEVKEILRRTAARQFALNRQGEEQCSGMTLDEIRQVATEVGLDASHVDAALESDERQGGLLSYAFRHLETVELTRTVSGPLEAASWEAMIREMRKKFGKPGTVSSIGQTLEWSGGYDGYTGVLTATPTPDGTRLHLLVDRSFLAGLGWISACPVAAIGSLLLWKTMGRGGAGTPLIVLSIVALVVTALLTSRVLLGMWTSRDDRGLRKTMDRIAQLAGVPPTAAGLPAQPESSSEERQVQVG